MVAATADKDVDTVQIGVKDLKRICSFCSETRKLTEAVNDHTNGEAKRVNKAEDEESGDEEETPAPGGNGAGAAKKKKKKSKKKKTGGAVKQTSPPTVPVSKFYPSGNYPLGEIREYTGDE
jgi:methionyl aminopeptidase